HRLLRGVAHMAAAADPSVASVACLRRCSIVGRADRGSMQVAEVSQIEQVVVEQLIAPFDVMVVERLRMEVRPAKSDFIQRRYQAFVGLRGIPWPHPGP